MTRKVLLTSLSDMGHSLSPRYFSVRGEFGYYYCDALLDAEASIKAALARFSIDEIIILGSTGSYDEGDELSTIPLSHGRSLYSADKSTLSSYGLLQYRIAQFADELSLDWKAEDGLPPETRERLIAFIKEFRESDAERRTHSCMIVSGTRSLSAFPSFATTPPPASSGSRAISTPS